jgi:hypothetical protein
VVNNSLPKKSEMFRKKELELAKLKGMEIQEASSNGGSLPAYD